MNRNGNPRDRSTRTEAQRDLGDYAGVQRGSYGRYDEDDWQPRESRAGERWGYGDFSAERGLSQGPRGDWNRDSSPYATPDAQRGDYRDHYGAERGHSHDGGYYGQGADEVPASAAAHPGRGGYGSGAHGGYAEHTSGQPGSGAYGRPRGRPGEDFRGRGPKNYVRSDERLREVINERLTADPDIDASEIEVEVSNGSVTLSGHVDRRQTRYHVEDLVDRCHGVSAIDNRLRIGPAQTRGSGDATNLTPPKT
jgi:hypothetical protein